MAPKVPILPTQWDHHCPLCSLNIYMEEFQQKAIEYAMFKPKVLPKYVDDTWSHGQDELDKFTYHLNNISREHKINS